LAGGKPITITEAGRTSFFIFWSILYISIRVQSNNPFTVVLTLPPLSIHELLAATSCIDGIEILTSLPLFSQLLGLTLAIFPPRAIAS